MLELIHPAFLCRGGTVNHIALKLSILPDRCGHLNSIQVLFIKLVNQMVRQNLLIFAFQFAHRLKMVDFLSVALSCFRFSNLMTNIPFIFKRLKFTTILPWCLEFERRESWYYKWFFLQSIWLRSNNKVIFQRCSLPIIRLYFSSSNNDSFPTKFESFVTIFKLCSLN